ncbi:MAG: hypothetical protein ABSC76_10405 [Terracidiphilus sp.]|jgi:hypothetical protein
MKSYPPIILRMKDGSTRSISAGVRELRLTDRAFEQFRSTIQGVRIRPAPRLDSELAWLRDCVSVEEPDGDTAFSELKAFIERLDKRAMARTNQRR